MRAMRLETFAPIEESPLKQVEVPRPEPGPGEILIKVNVCGICHTDLHTVEGDLPEVELPRIPGHQVVGTVAASGKGAARFREGDRVGAAWLYSVDESCDFCRGGRENLCEGARFTGYHVDGGYAEYMVIADKFAYAVPAGFSDEEAAPLLCGGIIGYRALRLSGIRPGQKLGMIGFGASAHVAIQVAVFRGCDVFVFSRTEEHRRLARKLGAVWVGESWEEPPDKLDAVINFTPAGSTVPDGMRILEKGGIQVLAGITMSPVPEMDYTLHLYHEKALTSVANATRSDGEDLLAVAAEIPIRTTTELFPLSDANRALRLLRDSRIDGAAVLRI
jgi:propanol-preferring alcohol dehydrogenase